jgi:50S ribosomal protein L16 3-hydroxylase
MRYPNLNLDVAHFLAKVWQVKPLLIKQAFPNFTDPIDENDLAGLALEPDIDSRIVSLHEQTWVVTQGPFEDFNQHCKGKWTLMVQGVDRWVDEISDLSRLFDFIPSWRFDDVMVSYSVPGAGVGPHVDQYDVFLIQGKGQRRWQVGSPEAVSEASPLPSLQQVRPFEPLIDEVLNPGDILYIPPGWPHCGTTVENCMTYSIGFRAPNVKDLLQPFNDSVLNEQNSQRFTDPNCIDPNEGTRTQRF